MMAVSSGIGTHLKDGSEGLGSRYSAQELPGNAGNRILFRNSHITAFTLGVALRSSSSGTTLCLYN